MAKPREFEIRPFINSDIQGIISVLQKTDLWDETEELKYFWVVAKDSQIIATAKLEDFGPFLFLTNVGVDPEFQGKGIGQELLRIALKKIQKPAYLDTIQHGFYQKIGFEIVPRPDFLPALIQEECRVCIPEKCRTMKWSPE